MPHGNLEQKVQSTADLVDMLRNNEVDWQPYVFPDEYTNWIEEQRAIRESCGLVDQSYHMEVLEIEGPDVVGFLDGLGANSFDKIRENDPPQAMNLLLCNPNGYKIGDTVLFYRGENQFTSVGAEFSHHWIQFNAEVSELSVTTDLLYGPFGEESPPEFRFQVQGPDALRVVDSITDNPLPDIPFFDVDTIQIDGITSYALAHGMAGTPGLEIFGPYEHHDQILDLILEAGGPYEIRRVGAKAYKTGKIGSGWIPVPVPAVYTSDEMQDYRKWLSGDSGEAGLSIGGSFVSDDISDYYMTPIELGQENLVDRKSEYVGKDALVGHLDNRRRKRVTFVWNERDVVDVYASLFQDGATKKFIDLPDTANRWSISHYDKVIRDGSIVGISKYPGYLYYEREMLSLGTIDVEHSDPGTEVTFVWGEDTDKRGVERHDQTEIRATVAPAPYVRGGRRQA